MICPNCKSPNNKVLETRQQGEGELRRRRECLDCKQRFSTLESWLVKMPYVIKKDGAREPFDAQKLRRGLQLACLKRPVSLPQLESIVQKVTARLSGSTEREVKSLEIGHWVIQELKNFDHVAYVRFASVYRTFEDVQEFVQSLSSELELDHTHSPIKSGPND
jgi:transcriptional repressor NrdR